MSEKKYAINQKYAIDQTGNVKAIPASDSPEKAATVMVTTNAFDDKEIVVKVNGPMTADQANKLWSAVSEITNAIIDGGKGDEVKMTFASKGNTAVLTVPDGKVDLTSSQKAAGEASKWIASRVTAEPAKTAPDKGKPADNGNNGGSQPTTKTTPPDKGNKGPSSYLEAVAGLQRGTKEYEAALAKWAASQF